MALPGEVPVVLVEKEKTPVRSVTLDDPSELSPLTSVTNLSPTDDMSGTSCEEVVKNKGGRKKGSTNKAKTEYLQRIQDATKEATIRCIAEKDRSLSLNMKRVQDGKFAEIIATVAGEFFFGRGKTEL